MKVVELFAGIGAWSRALEELDIKHEVVAAIEFDEKTMNSYNILHDSNFVAKDITQVEGHEIPDCDVIFYSPPCQTFSVAGRQEGFQDERGTLFFDALRIIRAKKPKYAIMENVKGLTQKKFEYEFNTMLRLLEDEGYTNYWKVIDAQHFGVPQVRERVFIVSIRNDLNQSFEFPEGAVSDIVTRDILEPGVEQRFHLSEEALAYMDRPLSSGISRWSFGYHSYSHKKAACLVANVYKGVPYGIIVDLKRRFTPLECFRLMGFKDVDHDKLKQHKVSNTQLYKMAGNSVVVNTAKALLENLIEMHVI